MFLPYQFKQPIFFITKMVASLVLTKTVIEATPYRSTVDPEPTHEAAATPQP
jgi:hypothetical protein